MRPRADSLEPAQVLGYLGTDNVLYCSRECAAGRGQSGAVPVDHDEYDALAESGAVARAVVCPVCGSDYPLEIGPADDRSA
jgi:hypothetical protein